MRSNVPCDITQESLILSALGVVKRGLCTCRAKRCVGTCMKGQHLYNSMVRARSQVCSEVSPKSQLAYLTVLFFQQPSELLIINLRLINILVVPIYWLGVWSTQAFSNKQWAWCRECMHVIFQYIGKGIQCTSILMGTFYISLVRERRVHGPCFNAPLKFTLNLG